MQGYSGFGSALTATTIRSFAKNLLRHLTPEQRQIAATEQHADAAEEAMSRKTIKLVREGTYAAEVPVELIEEQDDWSPYLSVEDARRLDAARIALRHGDLATASKHGRVFVLTPVAMK